MKLKKQMTLLQKRAYVSPDFELLEIEFEQNILAGSGELPGLDDWEW